MIATEYILSIRWVCFMFKVHSGSFNVLLTSKKEVFYKPKGCLGNSQNDWYHNCTALFCPYNTFFMNNSSNNNNNKCYIVYCCFILFNSITHASKSNQIVNLFLKFM